MTIIQNPRDVKESMEKWNVPYKSGFEAGRESVIANRETYQKVRAEGVREGMEKAAVLVGQAHHGGGNVFEYLAGLIRKEIDND